MLLIGVLLILVIFALWGWQRGIVRLLLSVASIIVTIIAGLIIAPIVVTGVKNGTQIDEKMANSVYEALKDNQEVDKVFGEKFNVTIPYNEEQVNKYKDTIQETIAEVGEKLNLPNSLVETVSEADETQIAEEQTEAAEVTLKELVLKVFANRIANVALTAIIYVLVMLAVFIVLNVIIISTGLITKLPIIKQANKLGGLVIGLVEGVMVVWLFFTVLTAISNTEFAGTCLAQIKANAFLSFMYDNNLITNILFNTIK